MIRDPSDGSVRKRREIQPDPEMLEVSLEAERQRAREEKSREWLRKYRRIRVAAASSGASQ